MDALKNKSFWQSAALIGLILLTRFNHFGDHVYLPDATLAALFLGGLLVKSPRWFVLAVAIAFGMDFYAIGMKGVSDYCMSLGYWGLIPTYAVVWGAGRWLAKQAQNDTGMRTLTAFGAFSIAFVLSNAFWYAFSDKVKTMGVIEFSQHVAQYFTPYVGYAMMYLVMAWALAKLFDSLGLFKASSSV